jgi:hypothetical protein
MDSKITVTDGVATCYSGPDATNLFRAMTLRSALKLAKVGISATRGVGPTALLKMAEGYSGKRYKRGQYDAAVADLTVWIETMKSALPVEHA